MSQILKLFPTPLYYEENVVSEEYNDFMINNCFKIKKVAASGGKGWFTNLYITFLEDVILTFLFMVVGNQILGQMV